MRCRGLAWLAIFFLVLLTACGRSDRSPTASTENESQEPQEALGVIKGHLEFEALRSPELAPRFESPRLEEVEVYAGSIDTADTYPGQIDNNRDYIITGLPGGRYNVIAGTRNKIYGGIIKEVEVTPGKTKKIQDVLFLSTLGRISGRVVLIGPKGERLPETGFVEVFIPGTSFSCRTTRKGEFTFYYIPAGEYTVVASYEGYEDTVVEGVEVALGSETRIGEIVMHLRGPSPESASVFGVVLDGLVDCGRAADCIVPIPKAKIELRLPTGQVLTALSGKDGDYRIDGIPVTPPLIGGPPITLTASKTGYEPQTVNLKYFSPGEERREDFHLIPITPGTGTLVGTVRERPSWYPEGGSAVGIPYSGKPIARGEKLEKREERLKIPYLGKPIAGAKVTALKVGPDGYLREVYTTTTGRDGEYQIPNMEPGEYTVRAEAEGFEAEEKRAVVKEDEVATVEFYLPPISDKGVVFGMVMVAGYRQDSAGGDLIPCGDNARCIIPIEGAIVSLYPKYEDDETAVNYLLVPGIPWPWLAVTDKEGQYRIEEVPFGPYTIIAEAKGFLPQKQEGTVSSTNPKVQIDFTLQPDKKRASIYGVVTHAHTKMPIPEADVTVTLFTGETFTTRTDWSGYYRIDDLPASDAIILIYPPPTIGTVTVSKPGYHSKTVDLPALTSGEERRIDLWLGPIKPGEGPQLTYSNSGCLSNREDPTQAKDEIIAKVEGNDIYVTHRNAWYNCCLEEIRVELEHEGNQLRLIETEILEGSGCRCLCLYDVSAAISDLAAGEYIIQVLNEDRGLIGEITATVP
ncbi:MAG: carboxypeptidase-like regulatory domain-containing protein [bacterium]